jgi:hypothetical protein
MSDISIRIFWGERLSDYHARSLTNERAILLNEAHLATPKMLHSNKSARQDVNMTDTMQYKSKIALDGDGHLEYLILTKRG